MKRLSAHYSGPQSTEFWRRVNYLKYNQEGMYCAGVILQNLEDWVLKQLRNAEQLSKAKAMGRGMK